jgi:tRNA G18 (ribose-2'-O)-methylase SpoU
MGGENRIVSQIVRIDDLNDPRLDPYRNLKDRDLARSGNRFIAESEQVVRRLLARGLAVESFLLAERRLEAMQAVLPAGATVFVLGDAAIEQVIGFHFHSGVMACGIRPAAISLTELLPKLPASATLMFLPDTNNTENLGVLMRIAAAFGVDALLLGPRCCDPYYRQAVRVSMGTVFSLRIIRVDDSIAALSPLHEAGFETVATVLDPSAETLSHAQRHSRTVLLFGNESSGLESSVVAACKRRVTIPMDLNTDSLNVAIAAGIVLHYFTRTLLSR